MGNLHHDSGTVPGFVVGSFGPAMLHVFQYLQGCIHQFMRFVPMNVDNHTYAASVMFISRMVKALSVKVCFHSHVRIKSKIFILVDFLLSIDLLIKCSICLQK